MLPCQQMNLEHELDVARRVAKQSAELALRLQSAGLRAESKPDESPVTNADRECERMICAALEEAFPEDGILGEEGSRKPSRSENGDGSSIRLMELAIFCVGNVLWSVEEKSASRRAMKWWPGVDSFAAAASDLLGESRKRAFRNDARMRVSAIADPHEAVLSVNSLNRIGKMPFAAGLIEWAGQFWAHRCLGGTPDAIMLAGGELDVWIEPKVAEWDLAAVQVILEEAGAVFFDLGGERTIYGGSAVATTPGLEREVRTFLGASGEST